jgi:hypothetical protein
MSTVTCTFRRMRRNLVLLLTGAGVGSRAAAVAATVAGPGEGVVTILEGDAWVLQGSTDRVAGAEGLKLRPGAIVETGARTALLRIELGGTAIDLGPDTRAMLWPAGFAARGEPPASLYLQRGWTKISAPQGATAVGLVSPAFSLPSLQGVAVAFIGADEAVLFLESGSARLVERRGAKGASPIALRNSECYVQAGTARGTVLPRPAAAMLERMPRAYRDTLPLRAARFEGRDVEGRALDAPSYAELQSWLDGEEALRRPLVRRFAARAREADFRRELIAHLPAHPEWRPVLYPPPPRPSRPRPPHPVPDYR